VGSGFARYGFTGYVCNRAGTIAIACHTRPLRLRVALHSGGAKQSCFAISGGDFISKRHAPRTSLNVRPTTLGRHSICVDRIAASAQNLENK
jgi:hypothetical protein